MPLKKHTYGACQETKFEAVKRMCWLSFPPSQFIYIHIYIYKVYLYMHWCFNVPNNHLGMVTSLLNFLTFDVCEGLVNWYDGGRHSIGYHSDNEKGLVPGAPIFAVSWGARRPLNESFSTFSSPFSCVFKQSCVIGHESFARSREDEEHWHVMMHHVLFDSCCHLYDFHTCATARLFRITPKDGPSSEIFKKARKPKSRKTWNHLKTISVRKSSMKQVPSCFRMLMLWIGRGRFGGWWPPRHGWNMF